MKEVCEQVGMAYETLRFYCNSGLVPNVQRDKNNYRVFSDRNVIWLKTLLCLKRCGMSISEMKHYFDLCMDGRATIPARKQLLDTRRALLLKQMDELRESIEFIDGKQGYFDRVLAGEIEYTSNLTDTVESSMPSK